VSEEELRVKLRRWLLLLERVHVEVRARARNIDEYLEKCINRIRLAEVEESLMTIYSTLLFCYSEACALKELFSDLLLNLRAGRDEQSRRS